MTKRKKSEVDRQAEAASRWVDAMADYLEWGGTPVDREGEEFSSFAIRNLTNAVRMWRTRKTGIVPVKPIENLGKITADNRWFYTPEYLYDFDGTYIGCQERANDVRFKQLWWWDSRLFVPKRDAAVKIHHMPELTILKEHRHQTSYITKARPRSLKARKPRHKKLGFNRDLDVIRCEPKMWQYAATDDFMRGVNVMAEEVTVFYATLRLHPKAPERYVLGVRDALRTWVINLNR